jgi:macrolide-specific efflux system membrane fusion protein
MLTGMQFTQLSTAIRRPILLVNLTLGALLLAGAGWAYTTVWGSDSTSTAGTSSANQATAGVQNVTATVSTSGTVASSDVVDANFTTTGTVTAIYVKLGDHVSKGQKLARIDCTAADQQLQTAQDNLTSAEDSLTTAKAGGDTSTIDTAQSQVDTDTGNVTTAQDAVDGCVLTSPQAGTVIAQNGTVGSSSSTTSSTASSSSGTGTGTGSGSSPASSATSSDSSSSGGFIQIADQTKMEVDTDFPEADATKLKVGMTAAITWSALTDATATGTVASIDPTATTSNNVVSYGVVVKLSSLPAGIRIGQSTTVVVTTASASNVLAVPTAAVRTVGTVSTVQLVGKTARTTVRIGVKGDQFTEITSGLTAGQKVALPAATTSGTGTTTNPFGGGGGPAGGGGPGGFIGGGAGTGGP